MAIEFNGNLGGYLNRKQRRDLEQKAGASPASVNPIIPRALMPNAIALYSTRPQFQTDFFVDMENKVVNGDFSAGTAGWNPWGSTLGAGSNKLIVTGSGSATTTKAIQTTSIVIAPARKYATMCKVKVLNALATTLRLDIEGNVSGFIGAAQSLASPVANQEYTLSGIVTTASNTTLLQMTIFAIYPDNATANGKVMEIQEAMLIDLTQIFGAGNEPTATEFQDMLTYKNKTFWNGIEKVAINPMPVWNFPTLKLENKVTNGDFSAGISGWTIVGSTISASNNILTVTGDGGSSVPGAIRATTIAATLGKVVSVSGQVRALSSGCDPLYIDLKDSTGATALGTQVIQNNPVVGQWYAFTLRIPLTVASDIVRVYVREGYPNPSTANGKVMEVKEVMAFDLTALYGAGNEPTAAKFKALLDRASGGAYFTTLNAQILMENLLGMDGNFGVDSNADGLSDGWTASGIVSKSISLNTQTILPNAQYGFIFKDVTYVVGDILYGSALVSSLSPATFLQIGDPDGVPAGSKLHSGSGDSELLSARVVTTAGQSANRLSVSTTATSGWTSIQIKNAKAFNLTQLFGKGNEPTQAQMDALMKLHTDYFASKVIPAGQVVIDRGRRHYWPDRAGKNLKAMVNLLGALGDFEGVDWAGWILGGATVGLQSVEKYTGGKALGYVAVGTGGNVHIDVAAPNGNKLHVCAFAKRTSGSTVYDALRVFDYGGVLNPIGCITAAQINANSAWTYYSVEKIAADGGIRFYVGSSNTQTISYYMDTAIVLDKTAIFGAGNEPSQSQMDGIMKQHLEKYGYFNSGMIDTHLDRHLHMVNMAFDATGGMQTETKTLAGMGVNLLGSDGNMVDSNADNKADGWGYSGGVSAISCADNEVVFTPSGRYQGIVKDFASAATDLIYGCAYVKSASALSRLDLSNNVNYASSKNHTGGGAYEFLSAVYISPGNGIPQFMINNDATSGWVSISAKQAHLLNLTAIFGKGNEPTKAEMDAFMKRQTGYFTQKFISVKRLPHVLSDGVNDYLVHNAGTDIVPANGAVSAVVVFQAKDVVDSTHKFLYIGKSTPRMVLQINAGPSSVYGGAHDTGGILSWVGQAGTVFPNEWLSAYSHYNPATKKAGIARNGSAMTEGSANTLGTDLSNRIVIGCGLDLFNNTRDRITEVFIFNRLLTDAEYQAVIKNLNNRYVNPS